jgi:general secretion pathway protein J
MKHRAAGFTLIEVLIAMSLLGIMMVLLFASLRISARNWNAGESRIAEVSQMATVQNFFQRHLSSARAENLEIVDEDRVEFAFQGDAKKLRFASALPASAARKGLQVFSISMQEEDAGNSLIVAIEPLFPAAPGEQWKKEEVILVSKISAFEMSYFGIHANQDEPSWYNHWLNQKSLPKLVKLEIEFDNGIVWPTMIISLRLSANKLLAANQANP